jgi:hypothetical protein
MALGGDAESPHRLQSVPREAGAEGAETYLCDTKELQIDIGIEEGSADFSLTDNDYGKLITAE